MMQKIGLFVVFARGPSLPLDAEHECMKLPKHVRLQVKHRGAMYIAHEPGIWAFSAVPF